MALKSDVNTNENDDEALLGYVDGEGSLSHRWLCQVYLMLCWCIIIGQVPTFDSDANHGGNEWVSIYNDSKTYVPVEEDVGRILRVECKALLANGDILAGKLNYYFRIS